MPAIGRVMSCNPRQEERFYSRLLLQHKRGVTSFEDMTPHQNIVYETIKIARARGMLQEDSESDACFAEALTEWSGQGLRHLFADLLISVHSAEPRALWDKYKGATTDDILRRDKRG